MRKTTYEQLAERLPFDKAPILKGNNPLHAVYELTHRNRDLVLGKWTISAFAYGPILHYAQNGKRTYRIGEDFGEALSKVKLTGLTARNLEDTKGFVAIEFPESVDTCVGEGTRVPAVFVSVTEKPDLFFAEQDENTEVHKTIMFVGPVLGDKDGMMEIFSIHFNSPDEYLEAALIRGAESSTTPTAQEQSDRLRSFVINCLLYIQSGDPDLREYRAPKPPATRDVKQQRLWARRHEEVSLINVTMVGYNYLKRPEYSVDSTTVRAHARWQPYGTGRTKLKLIWIEAHERHYRDVEVTE